MNETSTKIESTPTPTKLAAKPVATPTQQAAEKAVSPLAEFSALVGKAPKEHLPTMMVLLANKCMAEKVFATSGAMAEAIVGASKAK